jgi:hypothetical protein
MIFSDLYYFAKPVIPLAPRLAIRRILARHLRRKYLLTWPISEAASKLPEKWQGWPKGKKFAFVLTHDVEGSRGLSRSMQLAECDMKSGFRSSFNFVPEGEYRVSESIRNFLTANGFEVGVHDLHHNGTLYRSRKQFSRGAKKINQYVEQWRAEGFRSAFMRHNLKWLDEIKVLYDSSTFDTDPFEPQPDGVDTIFPFWVSQDGQHGYVELPYTLPQDSTLFLLLRESSISIWKRKLDWIAQHGGLALVNVHPDYINFTGSNGLAEYSHELYLELLRYVADRYGDECWYALPKDVARHFYMTMLSEAAINSCLASRDKAT